MVENTFLLRLDSEETRNATVEVPLVVQPYVEQASVLAIMNNFNSDSIIRIKEIQCNELIGRTTTALTAINLYRITALTGGDTITPTKYDSNATSLPSQVSIVKYPLTVTTTGSYLRNLISYSGLSATTALLWHSGIRGRSRFGNGGFDLNTWYSNHDSNVQTFVLREGEGLAFKSNLTAPQNFMYELLIHFSNGTDTFCISEILNMQSTTEMFAMVNGSGSGVVLYVSRIEMRQVKTGEMPFFSIESCSEIYNGTTLTPFAFDSTTPAIDSLVEFRRNSIVRQGNTDCNFSRNARAGGDLVPFRRMVQPSFGKGVGLASGVLQLRPISNRWHDIDKKNNIGEIVLREGEGLCILQRTNFSGIGRYEFVVIFTILDNGSAPSGVFPIIGGSHIIQLTGEE